MCIRHLRSLVNVGFILMILATGACTRSYSNPVPTSDMGIGTEGPSTEQEATMEAVRQLMRTQSAAATETAMAIPAETITPTAPLETPTPTIVTPTVTFTPSVPTEYTVLEGEWVWSIARKLRPNLSEDEVAEFARQIIELNAIPWPYSVYPGDVLKIPAWGSTAVGVTATPSDGTPSTQESQTYVVQFEDTVSSIAQRFGVSPESIIEENDLAYPYTIHPGDVLIIPSE